MQGAVSLGGAIKYSFWTFPSIPLGTTHIVVHIYDVFDAFTAVDIPVDVRKPATGLDILKAHYDY